ncbi:MAG: hypothetical protein AB1Z98_30985 [Nannocystaceae bacterium]
MGVLMVGSSCTLELELGISCGDGYVDEESGEECDPGKPSSFESSCMDAGFEGVPGGCDPSTCELLNTEFDCGRCGDGELQPMTVEGEEECDGLDVGFMVCPGGVGVPTCRTDCTLDYSQCRTCGNGVLDPNEECDLPQGGLIGPPRSCTELAPLTGKPYTSGFYNYCGEDCLFRRTGCGYCGNGVLEGPVAVDLVGNLSQDEFCDEGDLDDAKVDEQFPNSMCGEGLRPVVVCNEECSDVELVTPARCCRISGAPCPNNEDPLRCCFEIDNPDEAEACQPSLSATGTWEQVCL